ncbi:metallo-beta-lactamase superfamily [Trichoderma arundinaceum]|uniref:Metallo-beta-lactamase superfamily n=1 Tax=Trichoderma arundinaceum TaxID=490622 RepID=A0A395P0U7_TRIAR|nr:metallo-beta-lactamase superfamily [Trichoderma arundinaceum]
MSTHRRWLSTPPSAHTVRVRLIEEIGLMSLPSALFLDPVVEGHEVMNGADTAFLIENERLGKKLVFDLGTRKDWWNLPRKVRDPLAFCVGVKVEKDVPEVLKGSGILLNEIDDIIWSHSHLDHRGDVSLFPPNTTLNYGKAVAYLKPEITGEAEAVFLESDFAGRHNNEIDFSKSTFQIGGFTALDFYGDGSLYLLDTPGHDHGHLSALARTTSISAGHGNDTFILLAGDACHFCGVLRPNVSHPFPSPHLPSFTVGVSDVDYSGGLLRRHPKFQQLSDATTKIAAEAQVTPWYGVAKGQFSTFLDPVLGQKTADGVKEAFDEADNVFVAMCHDLSLLIKDHGKPIVPTLNKAPQEDLNDWYEKGWKDKLYWTWVSQLGKIDEGGNIQMQSPAVVGFWMRGKKYDTAQELFEAGRKEEGGKKL